MMLNDIETLEMINTKTTLGTFSRMAEAKAYAEWAGEFVNGTAELRLQGVFARLSNAHLPGWPNTLGYEVVFYPYERGELEDVLWTTE